VALDSFGNIYVADTNNNRIQKYDPDGNYLTVAGGFSSDFSLNQPWSMAVADDGTIFVADTWPQAGLTRPQEGEGGASAARRGRRRPAEVFGPRDQRWGGQAR
jgi:DNA-binding beta-propeller fold protein YncE